MNNSMPRQRSTMAKATRAGMSVLVGLCLIGFATTGASATDLSQGATTPDAVTTGSQLSQAVTTAEPLSSTAQDLEASEAGYVLSTEAGSVSAPKESDAAISVVGAAATVGIQPPGKTVEGVAIGNQIQYHSVETDTSLVVQVLDDNAVQLLTVLGSGAAPVEQRFELDLPADTELVANPDGSVSVLRDSREVGIFDTPWATDANGLDLATHYSIDNNTLIQTTDVDGATFPVVSDPAYCADCGWLTCTRWVSVAKTRFLYLNRFNSSSTAWGAISAAKCAISLVGGPLVGTGCAVFSAWLLHDLTVNLEAAGQNRRCIVVKYSRQLGFAFPTDYSNTSPADSPKCAWS